MIYAQIKSGAKLHLACEAGEETRGEIIRYGFISAPICGTPAFKGSYRMTCNLPLANACKNCRRVLRTQGASS